MKRRWIFYLLIGVAFGVFDFYYHAFISEALLLQQQGSTWGRAAWVILSLGIWLVPIIPIILHEAKTSRSVWLSALAASGTWCASVIAYYLNNAVQLAFIGVPSRPEMHISNRADPYFWANWKNVFFDVLIMDNIIWIAVAVIGGTTIGYLISTIYMRQTSGSAHPSH